ncbi:hypothetical protein UYO_0850 [Lachnospiraceae bacterium JC7]|nr:hypothetical protein UYO_0850 [Lachnospiraceae bacterium JC7]
MKTYKRLMTVAMAGIIAASISVPAFADVVHADLYDSATAAARANGTVELPPEVLLGGQVVTAQATDSAAAAAAANGTVALTPDALSGGQIVKAQIVDSATLAAAANAAYAAQN